MGYPPRLWKGMIKRGEKMETYTIQTKCSNCGAVSMITIDKGIEVNAKRVKCNNCGCAGTLRQNDNHISTVPFTIINEAYDPNFKPVMQSAICSCTNANCPVCNNKPVDSNTNNSGEF